MQKANLEMHVRQLESETDMYKEQLEILLLFTQSRLLKYGTNKENIGLVNISSLQRCKSVYRLSKNLKWYPRIEII